MTNDKDVQNIANLLTDDPDIFNEMAVSTGGIAAPPGGNIQRVMKDDEDDEENNDIKIRKRHPHSVNNNPIKTVVEPDKKNPVNLATGQPSKKTDQILNGSKEN
jgi:hypothetical protein